MPEARTTASIVCYRSDFSEVDAVLRALEATPSIARWVLVDNGARDFPSDAASLRALVEERGGLYLDPGGNRGFGAGHNAALKALQDVPSDFHLMLNPDIVFGPDAIAELVAVMDADPAVALMMPSVRYPDMTTQFLCKLLPTPMDFALRRFAPGALQRLARRSMDRYELRHMDFDLPGEIPFLSGCFMFTRRQALEAIRGFDEHYFLYMEDVDLCRRLRPQGKLLYWPGVVVTHRHERANHKSLRGTLAFIRSLIHYFNHWGWFFDRDRRTINRAALDRLTQQQPAEHRGAND